MSGARSVPSLQRGGPGHPSVSTMSTPNEETDTDEGSDEQSLLKGKLVLEIEARSPQEIVTVELPPLLDPILIVSPLLGMQIHLQMELLQVIL